MKADNNKQEKDQIIFEGNTFPFPNFIVDSGFLATIQGNPTLKVLLVILRHSTGFKHDTMSLSNSVLATKTGIKNLFQIRRAKKELKEKYKIIDYNQSKGGRDIQNIKVLLPEKFYNKDLNSLESAAKYLEKNGYKVLAPETKGDKKEVLQISENIAPNNTKAIELWNTFVLWANASLTRSSKEALKNITTEFKNSEIVIKGELSEHLKSTVYNVLLGKDQKIKVTFKD